MGFAKCNPAFGCLKSCLPSVCSTKLWLLIMVTLKSFVFLVPEMCKLTVLQMTRTLAVYCHSVKLSWGQILNFGMSVSILQSPTLLLVAVNLLEFLYVYIYIYITRLSQL